MSKTKPWILSLALLLGASSASADQESLNQTLRQEAINGMIPRIEKLIQMGADINAKAARGETALEYAIRFGRFKAALRLIELGANPNTEDDSGVSPLLRAASEPNASRVVEALLRAGADVNHHDLHGRTALMNAAHGDCTRTVAILLLRAKDKIHIEARDDSFATAYNLAKDGLVRQMLDMARQDQERGTEDIAKLLGQWGLQ